MSPHGRAGGQIHRVVDDCFGGSVAAFEDGLSDRAADIAAREDFWVLLREKHERRLADERTKPLASYRAEELAHMHNNFYGGDSAYHAARRRFVYKHQTPKFTDRVVPAA